MLRIKDGEVGVDVVITDPGQGFLPNTTETDIDGNVKEVIPDPNGNYDGEISYVTELDDVVVRKTGFGYNDGDDDNDTVIHVDEMVQRLNWLCKIGHGDRCKCC